MLVLVHVHSSVDVPCPEAVRIPAKDSPASRIEEGQIAANISCVDAFTQTFRKRASEVKLPL